ncbi:[weak similarity to] potassium channel protein [methanotrophic bacterial endosymbiont of Bathymodiolus sp.]|nr:[weak similarity to] potassium channel protein [methanotrophic bacterial endosymbiont of Bathymodiolus sp.]
MHGILHDDKNVNIEALTISQNCFLDGVSLKDAGLNQYKARLIGIVSDNPIHAKRRNRYKLHNQHFYFNPESSFVLYQGDILVLLGRQLSIDHLQDLIETSRLRRKSLWTMN